MCLPIYRPLAIFSTWRGTVKDGKMLILQSRRSFYGPSSGKYDRLPRQFQMQRSRGGLVHRTTGRHIALGTSGIPCRSQYRLSMERKPFDTENVCHAQFMLEMTSFVNPSSLSLSEVRVGTTTQAHCSHNVFHYPVDF